jgi:hypothetical protein
MSNLMEQDLTGSLRTLALHKAVCYRLYYLLCTPVIVDVQITDASSLNMQTTQLWSANVLMMINYSDKMYKVSQNGASIITLNLMSKKLRKW